ncbi:2-aminoethanethiol dioxygenase [Sergentomyia squamirostris]
MSVHFAKIVQQTRLTFDQGNRQFASNFVYLQRLMDDLKLEDINISTEVMSRRAFEAPEKAPCTFIHIYECPVFSMSIFVLAENYTMPIHDHPRMYGLLKCLSGKIKVQSYTSVEDWSDVNVTPKTIQVDVNPARELNPEIPASILTPRESNYHEITAVDGAPGAFFDILAPPYDSSLPVFGKRKCSFYRRVQELSGSLILEKTPTPLHYYCDNIDYNPPHFLLN